MRYKIVVQTPDGKIFTTGKGRHKSYKDKNIAEDIALQFSMKKPNWKFRVVSETINNELVFGE